MRNRCPFTAPLRDATAWTKHDECGDTGVNNAIERWHVEHDIPCPPDAQFAAAVVEEPVGSEYGAADRLRVTMPNGNRYWLTVEREGDLRGDSWREVAYHSVQRASIAPRRSRPESLGAGLTIAVILLCVLAAFFTGAV